jgi:hypothetical protein
MQSSTNLVEVRTPALLPTFPEAGAPPVFFGLAAKLLSCICYAARAAAKSSLDIPQCFFLSLSLDIEY